jgi:hypothetical protein
MVLPAGFLIIQRRLFYPLLGVAESSGMGWRNGSEQGGGINRIAMAESPGILVSLITAVINGMLVVGAA